MWGLMRMHVVQGGDTCVRYSGFDRMLQLNTPNVCNCRYILPLTAHLQISELFRSASYQTLLFAPPILHPDYVTCTCTAAVLSSPCPFVTAELLLVPEHSYGEDLVYEVTVMAIQEECVQY